jgi:hypothetical protein
VLYTDFREKLLAILFDKCFIYFVKSYVKIRVVFLQQRFLNMDHFKHFLVILRYSLRGA